jgi:hypothetical protein
MRWSNLRPTTTVILFITVGVVLLAIPFTMPVSAPIFGEYGMGYIDWPGAVGVAPLGVGLISIGILYLVGSVAGTMFVHTARGGFGAGLLVFFLGILLLLVTYWGYSASFCRRLTGTSDALTGRFRQANREMDAV